MGTLSCLRTALSSLSQSTCLYLSPNNTVVVYSVTIKWQFAKGPDSRERELYCGLLSTCLPACPESRLMILETDICQFPVSLVTKPACDFCTASETVLSQACDCTQPGVMEKLGERMRSSCQPQCLLFCSSFCSWAFPVPHIQRHTQADSMEVLYRVGTFCSIRKHSGR